uniref:Uncharacterized protein n=1 Tax=Nymphaea colorata TaxID=210225 RepID=A0A5K1F1T1_9MAGN|nr:unnamed protein product [Nymphaea colorata]
MGTRCLLLQHQKPWDWKMMICLKHTSRRTRVLCICHVDEVGTYCDGRVHGNIHEVFVHPSMIMFFSICCFAANVINVHTYVIANFGSSLIIEALHWWTVLFQNYQAVLFA